MYIILFLCEIIKYLIVLKGHDVPVDLTITFFFVFPILFILPLEKNLPVAINIFGGILLYTGYPDCITPGAVKWVR